MKKSLKEHPLYVEFHERNTLHPENILLGSHKKVWWRCSKNPEHEWEAVVKNRTNGAGCPFCAGQRPTKENNLSLHPLSSEFHPTKNHPKTAEDFTLKSNKKIWWICDKGHEWEAIINNRTRLGNGCPHCSGFYSSPENNLSLHPVAKEFHYERNSPLRPEDFLLGSNKRVWWQCDKGHEWQTSPLNRIFSQSNCPICANSGTSKAEQEIIDFITNLGYTPNHRPKLDGVEADIFIPEKNLAIEFNGLYWHSSLFKHKNDHLKKYQHFRDRGIQLIQVWEDEWKNKQGIIKSILQQKLGVSPNKIYARKCSFVEGDFSQFIEDNHISGKVRASRYLGLKYQGELVAVMSLRKPFHKKWSSYTEIARFCTKQNTSVVGGLSRLLSRIDGPVITYADCRFGSGDSYETVGFKRDGHTGVSLEWTDTCRRFNRFKFKASNGKTQKEVADESGVVELWGPGSWRFTK